MSDVTDISDSAADVEPCPFCGETPQVSEVSQGTMTAIVCGNEGCDVRPWVLKNSRKEAVDVWNTRLGQ